MTAFDGRLAADPQIGPKVLAGARYLSFHRMMRDGAPHWRDLSEADQLQLIAEASVVIAAAGKGVIERTAFLRSLIGKRWRTNARGPEEFDCWHLARHVQHHLFGRELPDVEVPADLTWSWLLATIDAHPERASWIERPQRNGLIAAGDGSLVLMARVKRAAHFGVWLTPERGVIHCDQTSGVMFEDAATLRAAGWRKLMFFEPKQS